MTFFLLISVLDCVWSALLCLLSVCAMQIPKLRGPAIVLLLASFLCFLLSAEIAICRGAPMPTPFTIEQVLVCAVASCEEQLRAVVDILHFAGVLWLLITLVKPTGWLAKSRQLPTL